MLPATLEQRTPAGAKPKERPYALARLEESARAVKQAATEMPALRRRLEKRKGDAPKARETREELQGARRKLAAALDAAALALMEAGMGGEAGHAVKLGKALAAFSLQTPDYSKMARALESFLETLPLPENGAVSAKTIGRLMNSVKMGYYPTCPENLAGIARGIAFPEGAALNLLDPCCGCGLALRQLAEAAREAGALPKTYGVELDTHRAEEALGRLDRVGFGSYHHSRISSEAFHLLLLNPPYMAVMAEGGGTARSEKRFLADSIGRLLPGGLLVYVVPHYRLSADIARAVCDNFENVGVWKFTAKEFGKHSQAVVMGTRTKRRDGSEEAARLAALALSPESLPETAEIPEGLYALPETPKEVALFKGAKFNVAELAEQLSKSRSFSKLYARNGPDGNEKRPLLPLTLGQIGLVGGSGLINGLVECESPHVIKGRVVKEQRLRTEETLDARGRHVSTTETVTTGNKLVFNLLTPQGFVSLTESGTGTGSLDHGKQAGCAGTLRQTRE